MQPLCKPHGKVAFGYLSPRPQKTMKPKVGISLQKPGRVTAVYCKHVVWCTTKTRPFGAKYVSPSLISLEESENSARFAKPRLGHLQPPPHQFLGTIHCSTTIGRYVPSCVRSRPLHLSPRRCPRWHARFMKNTLNALFFLVNEATNHQSINHCNHYPCTHSSCSTPHSARSTSNACSYHTLLGVAGISCHRVLSKRDPVLWTTYHRVNYEPSMSRLRNISQPSKHISTRCVR